MIQLFLHLLGDYFLQTDEMANNKTNSKLMAALHCFIYTLPFFFILDLTIWAALFIFTTHWFIDHYRLAKYVIMAKNKLYVNRTEENAKRYHKDNIDGFGFPKGTPEYIGFMVLIIVDNTMHLVCNYFAIMYL